MSTKLQESKSFPYFIPVSVSGKAGETKTVSASASAGGRLLKFQGYRVEATDTATVPGGGTVLVDMLIGSVSQQYKHHGWGQGPGRGPIPTNNLAYALGRGDWYDVLHPRLDASFVVQFKEDCTWTAELHGYATEVPNEGVYATVPTVACTNPMPAKHLDVHKIKAWEVVNMGRVRCEHCWLTYGEHPQWPWRALERQASIEVVEPGKSADLAIATDTLVLAGSVLLPYELRKRFSTAGFAVAGTDAFTEGGKFNYHSHLLVPKEAGGFILRVANVIDRPTKFDGTVTGQEFRG